MSKKAAEHHKKAAEHHTHAAVRTENLNPEVMVMEAA